MIWVIIGLVLMTVFNQFSRRQDTQNLIDYSQFISDLDAGRVQSVTIEVILCVASGSRASCPAAAASTYAPYDPQLVNDLLKHDVRFAAKPLEEEPSMLMNIFISWFPMLLLIGYNRAKIHNQCKCQ